jgi:sarcosine oxidase
VIYDVFIAGLGAMGGALARSLAKAGARVIGCDRYEPPHNLGSSHGESRIIRAAYFEDPVYVPLAQQAFADWRALERETGRSLLRITGGLNIGRADGMLVTGALLSARQHGLTHEVLPTEGIRRRHPGLRVRPDHVAVYEPEAGILDPEACVAAQLQSAQQSGAELHYGEQLVGWERTDYFRIETSAAKYEAKQLVLAVGGWLPAFRPGLPLTITRQPIFWFDTLDPEYFTPRRLPHYLIEFEPGRVFYGFPDLGGGVKCAIHHEGDPTHADAVDRELHETDLNQVRALVREFLPDALGPLRRSDVCLYTKTADGHFLIDRDRSEPGLWLMSPCSGHGFKFAPALGDLLANALLLQAELPDVFCASRLVQTTAE